MLFIDLKKTNSYYSTPWLPYLSFNLNIFIFNIKKFIYYMMHHKWEFKMAEIFLLMHFLIANFYFIDIKIIDINDVKIFALGVKTTK